MDTGGRPGAAASPAQSTSDMERELDAARAILRARVRDLGERSSALSIAELNLSAAQDHIRNLQTIVESLRGHAASREEALAHLRAQVQSQQKDVAAARTETADRARDNVRLQDAIDKLRAEIAAAAAASGVHIANLEQRVAATAHALAAIRTSTSWKLTTPFRAVMGLARGQAPWRTLTTDAPCVAQGFTRSALLDPGGAGFAGWTLLSLTGANGRPLDTPLMVRIDCADGRALAYQIKSGADGPHLFRLPDNATGLTLETEYGGHATTVIARARSLSRSAALRHILRHRPGALGQLVGALGKGSGRQALEALAAPHMPDAIADFERWTRFYDTPGHDDLMRMRARAQVLREPPTFSIVTPVYNTPPAYLREMIASVEAQAYPHWTLCIADDASPNRAVREVLHAAVGANPRIKVDYRATNGNISAASNSALALADGSHIALLDHDDVLPAHALATAAQHIIAAPRADIFYSDEDKIDGDGRRFEPFFKPDWNEELIYAQNYANHLTLYRTNAVRDVGGFRLGYEGSQDYDLLLRVLAKTKGPVVHIPHILYHWRIFQGAGNFSLTNMRAATEAARRAIREKFESEGVDVDVLEGFGGYHRLKRPAPKVWPKVSVIIPTRDHVDVLKTCITGLFEMTDYPDLEIIVVDNGSEAPATLSYLAAIEKKGVRILPAPGPFNFSRLNNLAARAATGEILLLLNNDISMISTGWLKEMVVHAVRPEVGAVGARLLYPDGTVQHGGVILGVGGVAGHIHVGAAGDEPGYFARLKIAQEISCVTAACLATPKRVFDALGGLDEENLAVAFNDVDYCVRVREAGHKIIWTPHAELTHWESKSRGSDQTPDKLPRFQREIEYMRVRWSDTLANDPYYNPNLDLFSCVPRPGFPPRVARPWT